ncbi:MAG: RNA-directed DNA polymerase, partial [Fibrobacterota bacterium]
VLSFQAAAEFTERKIHSPKFMRACSHNYTKETWILKMDIKGYFMSINKDILREKTFSGLNRYKNKTNYDQDLVTKLIKQIIYNDPRRNCIIKGRPEYWNGLPPSKSLFSADTGRGLPIGNLTSQLFGNIYLDSFDHYVKKDLGIKYYGRYVDDFFIVHNKKEYLKEIVPVIAHYLERELKLKLHPDKLYLQNIKKGIKFLGAVIKPYRKYISRRTKGKFYNAAEKYAKGICKESLSGHETSEIQSSINSYLGILKHYKTHKIRKRIIKTKLPADFWNYFYLYGYKKIGIRRSPCSADLLAN